MTTSFGALCSDFYVNQKLALKMDLPMRRDTVLDMFDRVRREMPFMERFRRYQDEVALESVEDNSQYGWVALRKTSLRSGWVNPDELKSAYRLHRLILEVAPYYLSISPLDVDYIELVFGFDLEARTNRNEIVYEALLGASPLMTLIETDRESVLDVQPFIGFSLTDRCDIQAFVEVKTRTQPAEVAQSRFEDEPISVYLSVRRCGPFKTIEDFSTAFGTLAGYVERLAEERVIPHIVVPIREAVLSGPE